MRILERKILLYIYPLLIMIKKTTETVAVNALEIKAQNSKCLPYIYRFDKYSFLPDYSFLWPACHD